MLPCLGCAYRRTIPGDEHISCAYGWMPHEVATSPMAHPVSPRVRQWYQFPFNYDPLWGPDTCAARAEVADPAKARLDNPIVDMLSILGRRF